MAVEAGVGAGVLLEVVMFYILKLVYSLQNCVAHLKKTFFNCQHNFMKKKLPKNLPSKNEPV